MQNTSQNLMTSLSKPSFEMTVSPPLAEIVPTDAVQSQESSSIVSFSVSDRRLQLMIDGKICDKWGNPTEKFQQESFGEILPSNPIYAKIQEMIGSLKVISSPVDHNQLTVSELLRSLINFPKKLPFSQCIQDTQMMGNQIFKILLGSFELLQGSIAKIFGEELAQKFFKEWIAEVISSQVSSNGIHQGQEIDFRIVCPKATAVELAFLSGQIKRGFFERFPDAPKETINKFHIINEHMTLVGFDFTNRPEWKFWEFLITDRPDTLSSDTCLWISFFHSLSPNNKQSFKINCLGFSPAKFFIDLFGKIYTPYDFKNPQVLVRYWYHNNSIPLHDGEAKMVGGLLEPFENVDSFETYFEALKKLDYKGFIAPNILSAINTPTPEDFITEYLYILIRRRIKSKTKDGLPPHPDSNAAFVFRCCQCLYMYKKLTDQAIANLIHALNKDRLLIYSNTQAFFTFCIPLISKKALPFSLVSSMTTLIAWFYEPQSFTSRQNPSIFFMLEPFTLRVPTDLAAALTRLQHYLNEGGSIKTVEEIHQFFTFKKSGNFDCYKKICNKLNLAEELIHPQLDFFLNHSDSFICSIGVQVKLIFDDLKNDFFLFEKLPKLLELEFNQPLHKLYHQRCLEVKSSQNRKPDYSSLAGWIQLFIQSNDLKLTRLAYRLWKDNSSFSDNHLRLPIFKALSGLDPTAAIPLYTELHVYETAGAGFSINTLAHLMRPPLFHLERIYPLLKQVLNGPKAELTKCQQTLFIQRTLNFIECLENVQEMRWISLAMILSGYLTLNALPAHLRKLLTPLLPLLVYREEQDLIFSLQETQTFLSLFSDDEQGFFSTPVLSNWTALLIKLFYPESEAENHLPVEITGFLKVVHEYTSSDECDVALLSSISNALIPVNENRYRVRFSVGFENDLEMTEKIENLILNNEPLISYIGLKIGLHCEKLKNRSLFLNALPKLLEASLPFQGALRILFQRITETYHFSFSPFNPAALNDWIKLLAQSKDRDLVDLAHKIWKENQAKCEERMHLKLFQALIMTNPHSALLHFYSLHKDRLPPLTPSEYALCLKMMSIHYQTPLLRQELEFLYEIFNHLLDKKKIFQEKTNKNFSEALIWLIEKAESSDPIKRILLKAIQKNYIRSIDLKGNLLDLACSLKQDSNGLQITIDENYQKIRIEIGLRLLNQKDPQAYVLLEHFLHEEISLQFFDIFYQFLFACLDTDGIENFSIDQALPRLKKLIAMNPGKKPLQTIHILKKFFNKFLETDFQQISSWTLSGFDEMFVNYPEVIVSLANWHNRLLNYLNTSPVSARAHSIWILFTLLFNENCKKPEIKEVELQRTFAVLVQKYELPPFSSSIQSLLSNRLQIVRSFIKMKEWKIFQAYLSVCQQYKLSIKEMISEIWHVCFQLSKEGEETAGWLSLLETQSFENWKRFFCEESRQQLKLEFLQIAINRLIQQIDIKENSRNREWFILFLTLFLQQSRSKIPFDLDCSDETFLSLVPSILSMSPSYPVKEYLFFKREHLIPVLKEQVRNEMEALLSNKVSLSFCLKITEKYFSADFSLRHRVLKLATAKDKQLISEVIDGLEKFDLVLDEGLAYCWIEVFNHLKKSQESLIWKFLANLPRVFEEKKLDRLKQQALMITIEGSASNLRKSPLKDTGSEQRIRQDLLLNKISQMAKIPFELFIKVLTSLDKDFLNYRLLECLFLTFEIFTHAEPSTLQKFKPSKEFTTNFHSLLEYSVIRFNNLKTMVMTTNKGYDIYFRQAIEFCLKFGFKQLNLGQTTVTRDLAFLIIFDQCNFFKSVNGDKFVYFQRIFSFYSNFSCLFNQDLTISVELDLVLMKIKENYENLIGSGLNESEKVSTDFCLLEPKLEWFYAFLEEIQEGIITTKLDVNTLKSRHIFLFLIHFLMYIFFENRLHARKFSSLLTQALASIFPDNLVDFHHSYFQLILICISAINQQRTEKLILNELCVTRVLEIMQKKKKGKIEEFSKINKIFKEGMNWLIKFYYQDENYLFENFIPFHNLLTKHTVLSLYERNTDPWMVITAYILPTQLSLVSIDDNNLNVYLGVIARLIEYDSYHSTERACNIFLALIDCTKSCSAGNRINLFASLLTAICNQSEKAIEKPCLLTSFTERRFCNSKPLKSSLISIEDEDYNYYKKTTELEFEKALFCIEKFIEEEEACLLGHYIALATRILEQRANQGFFLGNQMFYVESLEKLLSPIVKIEKLNLNKGISVGSFKLLEPTSFISFFLNAVDKIREDQSAPLVIKQQNILNMFFRKLFFEECLSIEEQEKISEKVLACLFQIIEKSLDQPEEENKDLLFLVAIELQKYSLNKLDLIYFKIIELHCLNSVKGLSPEKPVEQFDLSVELLIQIPLDMPYWKISYRLIYLNIPRVFRNEPDLPLYQEACLNFLNKHLEIFNSSKEESLNVAEDSINAVIHTLLEFKLLRTSEAGFAKKFSGFKEFFTKNNLNSPLISFCELLNKAPYLSSDLLFLKTNHLMEPFIRWFKEMEEFYPPAYFFDLFNYLSEDQKGELIAKWHSLVNL